MVFETVNLLLSGLGLSNLLSQVQDVDMDMHLHSCNFLEHNEGRESGTADRWLAARDQAVRPAAS